MSRASYPADQDNPFQDETPPIKPRPAPKGMSVSLAIIAAAWVGASAQAFAEQWPGIRGPVILGALALLLLIAHWTEKR